MRFRITTFAQDGAAISQVRIKGDNIADTICEVSDAHYIDADVTRLVIDELGEDGEPVTKGEG